MAYTPKPGMTIQELDTPALLLDLDALEHNLRTMQSFFTGTGTALRPHIKTHKCPQIAQRQVAAGAVGITCAKVSEAEVMAQAGLRHILIANQVTGAVKVDRLTDLARQCDLMVAVDHPRHVEELAQACQIKQVRLGILIEVDVGMGRCGVQPGAAVLELAQQIAAAPNLTFMGLQAYEGHLVLTVDPEERERKVRQAFAPLAETCDLLKRRGQPAQIVSGGGTGTYSNTGACPPFNEVQAGSYVFMDSTYIKVRPEFRPALTVLSTVLSRKPDKLVADAGLKAMTTELGLPQPLNVPGAATRHLSEEHCVIALGEPGQAGCEPGDKLRLLPSHCCTTTNLYNALHAVRGQVLVDIWPIAARGCSQ